MTLKLRRDDEPGDQIPVDLSEPLAPETDRQLNRDIAWLEFNRRVLHEALDQRTPLLERLMFLGIFTSNLDEFFMKRVGALHWRLLASRGRPDQAAAAAETLTRIRQTVLPLLAEQDRCFREDIRPQLAAHGIQLLNWRELTTREQERAGSYFRHNVMPALTPQCVDPSHPFPFMSNLSISLAVMLMDPDTHEQTFARLKIPRQLREWIQLGETDDTVVRRFISLEELVHANLASLFPGMDVLEVMPFRVTRSAALGDDREDAEDLLETVELELRQRRLQHVVRLEHGSRPNKWLLDEVIEHLELDAEQVYEVPGVLDYTTLGRIASLPEPTLRFAPWTPVVPRRLEGSDSKIFARIRKGDLLLHHPYESFDASVARFLRAAVDDPKVVAIKMTVYRTSDDSPFLPLMIRAAEAGKQVVCLVELKARFDEDRNIRWANALVDAGVHVVYGVIGVKTHTKTALVVRQEGDRLRCYAHIGTGNYNPQTARLYTDLGLFTCRTDITEDVAELFHYLTGRSKKDDYQKLLVSPVNMKTRFLEMIDRERGHHEAGRPAHIRAKMNQVEDPDIIDALYKASQAGVPIDLLLRGFCCLRPGVPGLSPTIRVVSVIGRFLEHSRIFYFRNGAQEPRDGECYIGSADWMRRNLVRRVEAVTPLEDPEHRQRCLDIMEVMLNDQRQAWDMMADGSYRQRTPAAGTPREAAIGTHQLLMEHTLRGTPPQGDVPTRDVAG